MNLQKNFENFGVMKKKEFKIILIILIIIIAFSSYPITKEILKNIEIKNEIANIENQINDLKSQNENLKLEIENLQNKNILELEAKAKLNLKKSGEEVMFIPQETTQENNKDTDIASKKERNDRDFFGKN